MNRVSLNILIAIKDMVMLGVLMDVKRFGNKEKPMFSGLLCLYRFGFLIIVSSYKRNHRVPIEDGVILLKQYYACKGKALGLLDNT